MRFIGLACVVGLFAGPPVAAQEPHEVEAVQTCLDAAQATTRALPVDVTGHCVGAATQRCLDALGAYGARDIPACMDQEAAIWQSLTERHYAELLATVSTWDDELEAEGLPKASDDLRRAHEVWGRSGYADCDFAYSRWGLGTQRDLDAAQCYRDRSAQRAILYNRWLFDARNRSER